ncbi:MAG: peptidase M23 [Pseudomonadota bacterium]
MRTLAAILVLGLWCCAALSQESPAIAARNASDQLEQAAMALDEASSARDRVRALTTTVRAYEAGLTAMREGLRQAIIRERQITQELRVREAEISQLLGVMQTIETSPAPVLLLHPSGPMGAARSAMMLAEVTPGLNAEAQNLARDLEEVQNLRSLQQNAARILKDGLTGVQQARAELSTAIADRKDLPRRFTEDPVRTAILISSTETLDGFADGLSEIARDDVLGTNADITVLKGELDLPVQGLLLHKSGEADAAGVRRKGVILATRSRALVTSPTASTIRYLGPLLDLGNVVILEPQPDLLFILSGLAEVFGEPGQVIPQGAPVGLMGGAPPEIGAILSTSGDGTGNDRSESLYIEVRQSGSPVDPEIWFRTE